MLAPLGLSNLAQTEHLIKSIATGLAGDWPGPFLEGHEQRLQRLMACRVHVQRWTRVVGNTGWVRSEMHG